MTPGRCLLLGAAVLAFAGSVAAAPDPAALDAQLAMATEADDLLARIEILRRIVEADPANAAARRQLVELWLAARDYDLAAATLDAWPEAPADLTALTRAAVRRFRDEDPAGAIAILRAHLDGAPRDLAAQRALVAVLLTTNDVPAQITALDALLKLEPGAQNLLARANARLRAGDYPGALVDARAAQALAPEDATVKADLPTFDRLAEALDALPPLDAAIKANPRDPKALVERAWWRRYGGMNPASLADSDAALAVSPDSLAARVLRARTRYLLGEIKAEEARDADAIDVTKPLALDAILRIQAFDETLARSPKNSAALAERASALNAAEQFLLARRDAGAALALAPENSAAALELLFADTRLGEDPAPALRRLEAMKAPRADLALAYGYVANFSLAQGNLPLALEFSEKSLAARETAWVLKIQSAALMRLGRTEEGNAAMTRANALPQ